MATAIDLYSGIGGWTLGLRMADIEVIASYEWWEEANLTHNKNFGSTHTSLDIRKLKRSHLPDSRQVEFIVGSPPCTQFSLSNRAGGGDIEDGLIDIKKFLEVVHLMKPTYWAMENVPRVAGILHKELQPKGQLARYKGLFSDIRIYNCSDYGVPQDRRRMIAGNFPFELLDAYKDRTEKRRLKDVVQSLKQKPVIDPIYRISLDEVTDHVFEHRLSLEEARINQESKSHHPVYNQMSFPDKQDRPSRTITALCTRVSRESIIINDPDHYLRRLTVRERACLQSFPVNYQLFGNTYANKIRMVGNAMPPLLSFYIAQSMLETPVEKLLRPKDVPAGKLTFSEDKAVSHNPKKGCSRFAWNRSFWLAIKGLRFGSGVRFELRNYHNRRTKVTTWRVNFFYGTSKRIKNKELDQALLHRLLRISVLQEHDTLMRLFEAFCRFARTVNGQYLQDHWTDKDHSLMDPLFLIDELARYADLFGQYLQKHVGEGVLVLEELIKKEFPLHKKTSGHQKKLLGKSMELFIGMLIGSGFNTIIKGEIIRMRRQKVRAA